MTSLLLRSWRIDPGLVLPEDPAQMGGASLPRWFAGVVLTLVTLRSLIHLLAKDGGAHSIATIDLSVGGGSNIIGLFGQWGAVQLLLAALLWTLLLRYRGLTPLVLGVLLAEPFLRSLAGHLKPITTLGVAPGAALNFILVPALLLAGYMSLCPARAIR